MTFEFSRQTFEKYSNMRFHEKLSSGTEPCRANGQTDLLKLIAAFRNFVIAPISQFEAVFEAEGKGILGSCCVYSKVQWRRGLE
jgi:hypothetical protein